jgi:central glycolytic genes regulator
MSLREWVDIQKQLLPDVTELLKKRYTILHHIMLAGTLGRRTLAASLGLTERVLRSEIDFMKEQGLLEVHSYGMNVSESGRFLIDTLQPMIKELFGLTDLEERIRSHYGIKQVNVVAGNSETSPFTRKELGRAGGLALRKYVRNDDVVAVTGGSTMAELAEHLVASSPMKGLLFVPARGGLGESVEFQANSIASAMAKRTGGQYRLLHVPDHLGEEAYQSLIQEPNIREIVDVIRKARIVVHGIGDAMTMARRRKADEATIGALTQDGALAEAFGYYFDRDGKVVHRMPTVGMRLEDIQRTDVVIAVAGGGSKGEAIASVMKFGHEDVLVTDEAAALEIIKRL